MFWVLQHFSSSLQLSIMPLAFNSNNAVSRHFSTKSPIGLSAKTYTTVMIRIKTLQQQKQSRDLNSKYDLKMRIEWKGWQLPTRWRQRNINCFLLKKQLALGAGQGPFLFGHHPIKAFHCHDLILLFVGNNFFILFISKRNNYVSCF